MRRKAIEKIKLAKTRKKGHIATIQMLNDTVIIDVWKDKLFQVRYCINTETGEHEYWQQGVWKKGKFITALGENYQDWLWRNDKSIYPKINSKEEKDIIQGAIKDTWYYDDVWGRIKRMEEGYDYTIRERTKENSHKKLQEFMTKASNVPGDIREWFYELAAGKEYMFKKRGTEEFCCTNCGQTHQRTELTPVSEGKVKHNVAARCPSCGKTVLVKTRTNHVYKKPESLYMLEQMDDTASVLRIFKANIGWENGRHWVELNEEIRVVIYKRNLLGRRKKDYKVYYNLGWYGWHTANNANYTAKRGYMYPGDFEKVLKNTAYEDATRAVEFLASTKQKINYNRLLAGAYRSEDYAEKIEYLAKGGFRKLVNDTVEHTLYPGWNMVYYGPLDLNAKNIKEMFGINDRQKINRIRDENGGRDMVEWMQYSDETGKKIPQETLRWLIGNGIGVGRIEHGAGKYLSTTQLMHYIKRQQKEQYPGFTEFAILEQYNDYLSMCEACNKNMRDELTYRPRELKRRHDEIVMDKQQMDIVKEMLASPEEKEKYAQEMREKYPTAEQTLKEIKERYEYENAEYKIVVPETLVDIVKEGRALHHCAGSSERYFERIERRETYICFLRRKEQEKIPFYTIEVEPGGTIRQHRSYLDEEPGIEKIRGFLREWQKVLKKRLTERDRELAKVSKEKRKANIEELKAKNNTRVLQGLAEDFMDAEEIQELLGKVI